MDLPAKLCSVFGLTSFVCLLLPGLLCANGAATLVPTGLKLSGTIEQQGAFLGLYLPKNLKAELTVTSVKDDSFQADLHVYSDSGQPLDLTYIASGKVQQNKDNTWGMSLVLVTIKTDGVKAIGIPVTNVKYNIVVDANAASFKGDGGYANDELGIKVTASINLTRPK